MRARNRLAIGAVLAAALIGQTGTAFAADMDPADVGVTAIIEGGAIGSRTITLTAPVAMSSALGTATLTGSLATTVTEAARTGTNPWSLVATMTDLTVPDADDPADTTNDTIAKTAMAVSGRSVVQVAGGGTSAAASDSPAMSTDGVTLFTNTGQSGIAQYTGTYASTSSWTLTPPNGKQTGTYTGTVTLTLSQ